MATPQEMTDVKYPPDAPAQEAEPTAVPVDNVDTVAPDAPAADAAPTAPASGESEGDAPLSEQLPSEEPPAATPNDVADGCESKASEPDPVAGKSVAPSRPSEQLPAQDLPATTEPTHTNGTQSVAADHVPQAPALQPSVQVHQQQSKVSDHDAVTPTRKRRSHVTQEEDVAILRAIASVKPMDAEWGHVNRRWQQVAEVVMEEIACREMNAMLCRSRHKQLVSWFNPNRPMAFSDPLDEELYTLTAAAVEDMKKRELDENITRADLRTAFELMKRGDAPKSFEEFYDAVFTASRTGDAQSMTTEAQLQTQETGDHKEAFEAPIDTPKRSREVLAGTMTPRYATPLKRRKTESRGVSETEFTELKRIVLAMEAKLEGHAAVQRDVDELKATLARRDAVDGVLRTEVADLKTQMAGAVVLKAELHNLQTLAECQRMQIELLKNEIKAQSEKQSSRIGQVAGDCEAQRGQVTQLQSSLEAEQECSSQLETRIDQLQQDCVSRDQDRMSVMDTKITLLEEKVADFEAVAAKQEEFMTLYKESIVSSVNRRSPETATEVASLRATIEAERAERMSGHAQLLNLLHQIFAKEDRRRL